MNHQILYMFIRLSEMYGNSWNIGEVYKLGNIGYVEYLYVKKMNLIWEILGTLYILYCYCTCGILEYWGILGIAIDKWLITIVTSAIDWINHLLQPFIDGIIETFR